MPTCLVTSVGNFGAPRLSDIQTIRKAITLAEDGLRLSVELAFLSEYGNANAVFEWARM